MIWDPNHFNAIHQLEMIQHCAVIFLLNMPWRRNDRDSVSPRIYNRLYYKLLVSQMLLDLKWLSLQPRRSYSRILLMHKVIKNHLIFPTQFLPPPAYSCSYIEPGIVTSFVNDIFKCLLMFSSILSSQGLFVSGAISRST